MTVMFVGIRDLAFRDTALEALSQAVSAAPNNNGYAWSRVAVNGTMNRSAYVLANCWRTLSADDCKRCLQNASASIRECLPWSEGRVLYTGCFMRYSDENFLNYPLPVTNITNRSRGTNTDIISTASSALGATILIIGAIIGGIYLRKKQASRKRREQDHTRIELFLKNNENLAPKRYKYSALKKITNSFSTKLGKGGFGSVYKGKLNDGRLVAVKILNHEIKGNNGEEFMNEVASISRTSHINIVTLIGFCFESSTRALIYEFMPNGSLEKFLGNNDLRLGWEKLFQIAVGIAQGLEYLHKGCKTRILHLDIKPHNILLDKDFQPMISDFGLAKLCPDRASIISMLGTIGYNAPEIFCRNFGEVSHKSDVYSYGMLVLEMVGGRKNPNTRVERSTDIYFPDWIYDQLKLDAGEDLDGISDRDDECQIAKRKLTISGLWCIQTDPNVRPSISRVVEMLEGNLESLQIPPKPYLFSPPRIAAVDFSTFESSM